MSPRSAAWLITNVFRGGSAGQRQAILFAYALLTPPSIVASAVLSDGHWVPIALGKLVVLGLAITWLLARPRPRLWEWLVLAAFIPAGSSTLSQLAAGPGKSAVFAVTMVAIVALVSIVFERTVVIATLVCQLTGFAIVQFHFHPVSQALVMVVGTTIVFGFVVIFVHGAARYLRTNLRELSELYEERVTLHAEMASAADRERVRIAGELHDDTIQVLTAAALRLDDGIARFDRGDTSAAAAARDAQRMVRDAIERTRKLSFDLYPPLLEQGGLRPALQALGVAVERDAQFQVSLEVSDHRYDAETERLAYRTVKELVTNALKHSQASRLTVAVRCIEGTVTSTVEDDGRGFDHGELSLARRTHHIGLDTAAERVRLAGGQFAIAASPGRGTRIDFTIPGTADDAGGRRAVG